ncbi:N-formylglutamate amidohydrolase [Antarcticirhabdus aurantiaca]|uniref:N-formylglutamate amidohydrolase n=1 Tax=Antarcticirhabdus aurantiaca TaxID=2606717 RepID=A0ACD4NUM7_9HYPH|nr:N-formylglutamate amidohydrolase [Antarcticirhabdus aurantiaca]WAJ30531.1 N-formylglutamate amidohydrolase [Jeongeuplla avenae]
MTETRPFSPRPDGGIQPFEIAAPKLQSIPFVFCSPHSGRHYPQAFLDASRLDAEAIRRSEDLFVDRLFDFVVELGAPLISLNLPRAYIDVNREPYELDPTMFDGSLPTYVNSGSARVAGGLGTIPRIVAEREEIYHGKLAPADALQRIETVYLPFHEALQRLVQDTRRRFGMAILIDCHSMPSSVRAMPGGRRPDMVIGDRFGTSAAPRFVSFCVERLASLGYDVTRNRPYAGGFITERYGRPSEGVHAIQIEISRELYAHERRFEPHSGFARLRDHLLQLAASFAGFVCAEDDLPLAAE